MRFDVLIKNNREVRFVPLFHSLADLLQTQSQRFGSKGAVIGIDVDTGSRTAISYNLLNQLISQLANYLLTLKVKKGDRIAILMENTPEILLFELAAGLIGAATVPLDSKRDTLERKILKLKGTQAQVLFIKSDLPRAELADLKKIVKIVSFSAFTDLQKLTNSQPTKLRTKPVADLESIYLILYTSGTTAQPKGVALTVKALFANAAGIADWQKFTSQDRFNVILPLHHINSTTMTFATLISGGTVVLNSRYSASRFWNIIAQEKCTVTSIVPTVLHDLLMRHDEFKQNKLNVSSLTRILIGSAPVLPAETLKFYQRFQIRVVQGYGQTETALRVTGVPINLTEKEYLQSIKTNTIGVELQNCNVAILKSNGKEAKEKEEGEICIRGPVLAKGYWKNKPATKESFANGWFHSGDLGYYKLLNGKKHFYIIGRIKEIIIKGGINLSPALIEDKLLQNFPDISEISVVGYTDSRMGEEIAAVVVPKKGIKARALENLIVTTAQLGKIKNLSAYELPQKVFIVSELPKTSTGKIQRVEVKKMVAEKFKHMKPTHLFVRQIKPTEAGVLKQALNINNDRWQGLPTTLQEFTARAKNGLLFGVFAENDGLVGSVSCVQLKSNKLNQLKTWDQATAKGTLSNHDPKGDALLCVAISVKSSSSANNSKPTEGPNVKNLQKLAKSKIKGYVESGADYVLSFHKQPKGGLPGAIVWKILENGRPDDKDAMGYNVLMKYPEVPKNHKLIHAKPDSASFMLIEHCLLYAQKHGIKNVIAFSRPAGFRQWLNL